METSRLNIDVPNVLAGHDAHGAHRLNTYRFILERVVQTNGNSLVDLGAGPCLFAKIAEELGYEVTAVDARTVRKPTDSELGNVKFIHADVRDYDLSGFSVVSILGLFYHFEIDDQINLLERSRTAEKVVIETQVHFPEQVKNPPFPWDESPLRKIRLCLKRENPLKWKAKPWQKKIVEQNGYSGILYPEGDSPQSSVGNQSSFWHTEESILRMFDKCGYRHVALIDPIYCSMFGARRFYLLE